MQRNNIPTMLYNLNYRIYNQFQQYVFDINPFVLAQVVGGRGEQELEEATQ